MSKVPSLAVKIFSAISKGAIYLLVFLFPIFFLPWTVDILDFNKQTLLLGLVFLSVFCWMLKVLVSGNLTVDLNKTHVAIAVLFLVWLCSTIFSLNRYGSLWGWPLVISESLISLVGFILLYFLIINVFSKKEIFVLLLFFLFSGFLSAIFGILQLFGLFLVPLDFSRTSSFNSIGNISDMGVFVATLLPLMVVLLVIARRWLRIFFGIAILLSTLLLILINYQVVWGTLLVGCTLLIIFGILKREIFDNRWLILPMLFLGLCLFFIFFKIQLAGFYQRPIEIFLNQRTTFDIALKTLQQRPVLGSGPGTFVYDFSKYKKTDFNQDPFWNVRFQRGVSKILNLAATTGVLGILAFFFVTGFVIFYGMRFLMKNVSPAQEKWINKPLWVVLVGVFSSFSALSVAYFFHNPNFSLEFLYFFLVAVLLGLVSQEKKEYILRPSSLLTLGIAFVFTMAFIFGFGILILDSQHYIAQINYSQGLNNWLAENYNEAIKNLEKATSVNAGLDLYYRELSQAYLLGLNKEIARNDLPQEEKNRNVQLLVNNAVNAAKLATDINPNDVSNWSIRGFIYQNLIGVIGGVDDWAIKSYDEAQNLEPTNPYFPTQRGVVFLKKAALLEKEKTQGKEQLLLQAKEQFERAVQLKSDYAPARFQIAMVLQAQGKQEEAIQELENTKKIAPFDVGLAFQLGLVYYQNKSYDKAQAEFERAISISPNYANALYFLGLTYDELGKKTAAIEKFEKVAELNPDNEQVKKILVNLRAGRSALEGIIAEQPAQTPVEERPPERTKK